MAETTAKQDVVFKKNLSQQSKGINKCFTLCATVRDLYKKTTGFWTLNRIYNVAFTVPK